MKRIKHYFSAFVAAILICHLSVLQIQNTDIPKKHIQAANVSEIKIIQTNSTTRETENIKSKDITNNKESHQTGYILLNRPVVNVYNTPSTEIAPVNMIKKALEVSITESTEEWYKITYDTNKLGYVLKTDITLNPNEAKLAEQKITVKQESKNANSYTTPEPNPNGEAIVNAAKKHLGTKYVYGGSSPSGFDCSGLVKYVCNSLGIEVNRTAAAQFNNGKAVNKKDLMPGDLLFFAKNGRIHHVGIYVGNSEMIHAPRTGDVVKYSSINTPYRQNEYVGARRVY